MSNLNKVVFCTSLVGVLVCLYAMHVEKSAKAHPFTYQAYCDLGPNIRCSKVLTSPESHLLRHVGLVPKGSSLDLPNTYLGLGYYVFMLTFPVGRYFIQSVYTLAAIFSMGLSFYLAYLLYAVLKDFCLVCVSTYLLNFLLLMATLLARKYTYIPREKRPQELHAGGRRTGSDAKSKQT